MKRIVPLIYVRKWQIIKYGWRDAGEISQMSSVNSSRWEVFKDIRSCFNKYYLFSNIYKKHRVWELDEEARIKLGQTVGENLKNRDLFYEVYPSNWKFLTKYTSIKYLQKNSLKAKRNRAYAKQYGLSDDIKVQYGVTIICEHYRVGKLTTGKHVLFARNVDIDYTGDLTIGNGVSLSEGVKILTHNHDFFGIYDESELIPYSNRAHATPLVIEDNVLIGAHAIIMPGVGRIGENAIISAGSIVTKEVPPNVVVSGNPAEVVRKLPKRARIYYRTEKH